ncbi:MAG: transglutaminase-like domain-containing protein [Thermaerobacterales bacterium]
MKVSIGRPIFQTTFFHHLIGGLLALTVTAAFVYPLLQFLAFPLADLPGAGLLADYADPYLPVTIAADFTAMIIWSLAAVAVSALWLRLRWLPWSLLAGVLIGTMAGFRWWPDETAAAWLFSRHVVQDIFNYLRMYWYGIAEPPLPAVAFIMTMATALCYSRLLLRVFAGRRRWEWALAIGSIPFLSLWLYGENQPAPGWFPLLAMALLGMASWAELERIRRSATHSGHEQEPHATPEARATSFAPFPLAKSWLQALVFISLVAFLANSLPARAMAEGWPWLTVQVQKILPFTARGPGAGFGAFPQGGTGDLWSTLPVGGPFRGTESELLQVRVTTTEGHELPDHLYLRGIVRSVYDSRSWSVGRVAGRTVTDILQPDDFFAARPRFVPIIQHVEPLALQTDILYHTLLSSEVRLPDRTISQDRAGALKANTTAGNYSVLSLHPATSPTALQAAAEPVGSETGLPAAESQEYLSLPRNLPDRVHDLAADLTAGTASAYDAAKQVEAYLRQFPYHEDTPFTPPGRDFVDYFLFDLQRGYCTYYASAMVVLLRSAGIHARWVQGFILPVENGPGTYKIVGGQAHTWVEAFIPGYGWTTFEPTAAYPTVAYDPEERESDDPESEAGSAAGLNADDEDVFDLDFSDPFLDELMEQDFMFGAGGTGFTPRPYEALLAMTLYLFLLAIAVLWAARTRRERLPIDPRAAICRAYALSRLYLERYLSPPKRLHSRAETLRPDSASGRTMERMTAREFLAHVTPLVPGVNQPLGDLTEAYEQAVYADPEEHSCEITAPHRAHSQLSVLHRILRQQTGFWRYLWIRWAPVGPLGQRIKTRLPSGTVS